MKPVHIAIRNIGNSKGVVLPKPVLAQAGLDRESEVEMTVDDDAIVLRKVRTTREGWAQAAQALADAGDDTLILGEFGNEADADLVW
ncbi:MAG: AbrB/MazE/SpoVT family DNA-binding domain-containing protein [Lautropia sp.]